MGGGRRDRRAAGRVELARRLEREAGAGHAQGGAFHSRWAVVRELAERRLRRPLARRARRDGAAAQTIGVMSRERTTGRQVRSDQMKQAERGTTPQFAAAD